MQFPKSNKSHFVKLILIFITCLPFLGLSQINEKKYLLISYQYKYKHSIEGVKTSLFIIEQDSITSKHIKISPLWLRGFSDSNLLSCLNYRKFSRSETLMGTNISLDTPYTSYFKMMNELIKIKGRKIQKIKKLWENRQREIAIVKITPIVGVFCFSVLPVMGETGYYERVYIPLRNINYDDSFWIDNKTRIIKGYDYSEFMYHRRFY